MHGFICDECVEQAYHITHELSNLSASVDKLTSNQLAEKASNSEDVAAVNMQNVRSPIWSKFSSCRVVRFMVTPMQTQTATTTALINALRHRFFDIWSTASIVLSAFRGALLSNANNCLY